jgi:predicted ester cyclase
LHVVAIDELIAPNWVQHDPATPEELHRIEGARQLVKVYRGAFPDVHITVEDQVAEGDKVVTRWTALDTYQGELMGVEPSGNQVTVRGISIDRFSGGKFVETWDNYDALGMMQQIGAIPSM